MNTERNGAIPGIRRLAQTEEDIRQNRESIIPGVWYVDGIRYPMATFQDTIRILEEHQAAKEDFRILNERINQRAMRKITKEDLLTVRKS